MSLPVYCFGEVLIDFLQDPQQAGVFRRFAGGAPANVAVAVAKLGGDGRFVGMLGADMFGDFLQAELEHYGVNVSACARTAEAKTALAAAGRALTTAVTGFAGTVSAALWRTL